MSVERTSCGSRLSYAERFEVETGSMLVRSLTSRVGTLYPADGAQEMRSSRSKMVGWSVRHVAKQSSEQEE